MMAPQVFLDTAYAVALASPPDEHHTQALALAGHIKTRSGKFPALLFRQLLHQQVGYDLDHPLGFGVRRHAGLV